MDKPTKQRHKFVAIRHVKKGSRFIKENDRSILCQCTSNHHTLAFAIRHFIHRAVCISLHSHRNERLHDYLLICFLHPTYPVGIRSTAYGYDILAPQVGDARALGRDDSQRFAISSVFMQAMSCPSRMIFRNNTGSDRLWRGATSIFLSRFFR